ncbi:MAG: hypothetical protein V4597_17505, partial [Pseudomonadota bacterium]
MSGLFTGSGGSGQNTAQQSYTNSNMLGPQAGLRDSQMGNIGELAMAPYQPNFQEYANFNPTQQKAFGQVDSAQGSWNPYFGNASGALSTYMPQAQQAFQGALSSPTALSAAAPYTAGAAQTWPSMQGNYLNPYIGNTVNAANQYQSQNFLNNVLPGLTNQFVGSGGGLRGNNPAYQNVMTGALNNFNQNLGMTTQGALS